MPETKEIDLNLANESGQFLIDKIIALIPKVKKENETFQKYWEIFANLFDNMNFVVFWKDVDGRFIGCNDKFAELCGFETPDEVICFTDYDFFPRDEADYFRMCDMVVVNSKEEKTFVETIRTSEGPRYFSTCKIPLFDETEENVIGILGASQDITELKRMEELVRASEKQYKDTINAALDGIFVIDKSFKISLYNDALIKRCEETGISKDIIGKNVFNIFTFLDKNKVESEYQSVFKTGKPFRSYSVYNIGDNEYYTDIVKMPIIENGNVIKVVTIMHDVTEVHRMNTTLSLITKQLMNERENLRKTSSFYESLIGNIKALVWAKDLYGKYTFVNDEICSTLLWCNPEEAIGKTDIHFAEMRKKNNFLDTRSKKERSEDSKELTFKALFGCSGTDLIPLATEESCRFFEIITLENGKELFLDVYKSPVYTINGRKKLTGISGMAFNVSLESPIIKNEYLTLLESLRKQGEVRLLDFEGGQYWWLLNPEQRIKYGNIEDLTGHFELLRKTKLKDGQ